MTNIKLFSCLAIVILSFLFYGNTLINDYALDDAIVITQNQFTKQGISGINDIFTYDTFTGFFGKEKKLVAGGRYRPLSLATFAIEYELFGLNPHISHLINILLYAFLCILLYNLLIILIPTNENQKWYFTIPFITSILFLIHPVHTEVVSNIKGRDEILILIGSIAATIQVFKYLKSNNIKYLFYSAIWLFVGLLSKENAITFIAVIPITIYFFTKTKYKKYIYSIIPLIISSSIFLLIRKSILGDGPVQVNELMNNPFIEANFAEKYATIVYTLGIYIKLLIFPHPLTFDYYPYHIEIMQWNNIWVLLSLLLYIIIMIISIKGLKNKSLYSYSIIFYLITLSIVSNIIFPVGTFMNERFLFIPSIGFCLIIGKTIVDLYKKYSSRRYVNYIITMFLIFILSISWIKTFSRNKVWENDFSLFSTDVKTSKNSAKSNTSYGGNLLEKAMEEKDELKREKMHKTAISHLKKALTIHPAYVDALILAGNAYGNYKQMNDSALYYYKLALKKAPKKNLIFKNIHVILNRTDNIDYKIKQYKEIYKINPNRYDVCYNLGRLYGRYKGNIPESIKYLERAIYFKNDDFNINKDLGVAYGIAGNYEKSKYYFLQAIKINPNDIDCYKNLYITYSNLKQYDEAKKIFDSIKKLEAKNNL